MQQVPQNIIEKIQKLLNLKEGAEAVNSLAEAENAASKLQDLLMKWNLDLDQVKSATIASKAKINIEEVYINTEGKTKHSESFWIPKLYAGVARNNLCTVWWSQGKFDLVIVGHSHNIALVEYICDQLIDKIRIAEKYAWKTYNNENRLDDEKEKRGTWRRGFLEGAAFGIDARLTKDFQEMQEHNNNPYALMIVDKRKEVRDWLYEKYPFLDPNNRPIIKDDEPSEEDKKKKRPKKIKYKKGPRQNSSSHGWHSGYKAGTNMEINKGVNSKTESKGHIN